MIGSPTIDQTGRFPNDQRLRRFGFAILSRPQKGAIWWQRRGKDFTQEEALEIAAKEFQKLQELWNKASP